MGTNTAMFERAALLQPSLQAEGDCMKTLSNFIDYLARLIDRIQPGPVSIESSDEYWLNAARNKERERQSRQRGNLPGIPQPSDAPQRPRIKRNETE